MKKMLVILIILFVVGAVVFFFGWVNLFVPAGYYGVMISKTSGYDSTLIKPESGIIWRWENLIPTNLSIYSFKIDEYSFIISQKGSLPQAEIFKELAPLKPSFSYELNLKIYFRLKPEALPRLVENENLRPESIDAFCEKKKEVITAAILRQLALKFNEPIDDALKDPLFFCNQILNSIRDQFSELEITSLTPAGSIVLPDPLLYNEAKKAYLALLAEKENLELAKLKKAAELYQQKDIAFERSLYQLEKYGELLNRYPVLLKYLFIVSDNKAVLELPEIKEIFKQE